MSKKSPFAQVWGKRTAEFLLGLQDRPVYVVTTTSKAFRGILVGVDADEILIQQSNGLEILLVKSNIVYLYGLNFQSSGLHEGETGENG